MPPAKLEIFCQIFGLIDYFMLEKCGERFNRDGYSQGGQTRFPLSPRRSLTINFPKIAFALFLRHRLQIASGALAVRNTIEPVSLHRSDITACPHRSTCSRGFSHSLYNHPYHLFAYERKSPPNRDK
jgi:hypothetical protein